MLLKRQRRRTYRVDVSAGFNVMAGATPITVLTVPTDRVSYMRIIRNVYVPFIRETFARTGIRLCFQCDNGPYHNLVRDEL